MQKYKENYFVLIIFNGGPPAVEPDNHENMEAIQLLDDENVTRR